MYKIAYAINKGRRNKNDDRIYINGKVVSDGSGVCEADSRVLAAVCDGVGGEQFGDEAAEITASCLSFFDDKMPSEENIKAFAKYANDEVVKRQGKSLSHSRMSSTVAALYIDSGGFWSFNVGDSRVYRFIDPYISQISVDHSSIWERKKAGLPYEPFHEHIITRYIGGNSFAPFIKDGTGFFIDDDIFILCTDGVWNVVDNIKLEEIILEHKKPKPICDEIYRTSVENESDDNISVVVIGEEKSNA